jgi:hypothetical protein
MKCSWKNSTLELFTDADEANHRQAAAPRLELSPQLLSREQVGLPAQRFSDWVRCGRLPAAVEEQPNAGQLMLRWGRRARCKATRPSNSQGPTRRADKLT